MNFVNSETVVETGRRVREEQVSPEARPSRPLAAAVFLGVHHGQQGLHDGRGRDVSPTRDRLGVPAGDLEGDPTARRRRGRRGGRRAPATPPSRHPVSPPRLRLSPLLSAARGRLRPGPVDDLQAARSVFG